MVHINVTECSMSHIWTTYLASFKIIIETCVQIQHRREFHIEIPKTVGRCRDKYWKDNGDLMEPSTQCWEHCSNTKHWFGNHCHIQDCFRSVWVVLECFWVISSHSCSFQLVFAPNFHKSGFVHRTRNGILSEHGKSFQISVTTFDVSHLGTRCKIQCSDTLLYVQSSLRSRWLNFSIDLLVPGYPLMLLKWQYANCAFWTASVSPPLL